MAIPAIDTLLRAMLEAGGSDLHLNVTMPPKIRTSGKIVPLEGEEVVTTDYMEKLLSEICPPERYARFKSHLDLDFAYEIEGLARFRCNYLNNHWGKAAVFRQIPAKIMTFEELNLPEILKKVCGFERGLVCVTGPTGSGKSTTMAAMLDYINKGSAKHIITIEDPIEFVHQNHKSFIVHREEGIHTASFASALTGAMRADPDIILLGEMRDKVTLSLALSCATMGMLVFGTLHTNNAPKTIDRIIDAFPAEEQPQIRTMLAQCLTGVISQLLCKKEGGGRIAVHEILLWNEALPNTIREGKISNIRSIIEGCLGEGMCSMDGVLKKLYSEGTISAQECYMKANDKKAFEGVLPDEIFAEDAH